MPGLKSEDCRAFPAERRIFSTAAATRCGARELAASCLPACGTRAGICGIAPRRPRGTAKCCAREGLREFSAQANRSGRRSGSFPFQRRPMPSRSRDLTGALFRASRNVSVFCCYREPALRLSEGVQGLLQAEPEQKRLVPFGKRRHGFVLRRAGRQGVAVQVKFVVGEFLNPAVKAVQTAAEVRIAARAFSSASKASVPGRMPVFSPSQSKMMSRECSMEIF